MYGCKLCKKEKRMVIMDSPCCYPIFDPCFDKFLEKKSKNTEKQ